MSEVYPACSGSEEAECLCIPIARCSTRHGGPEAVRGVPDVWLLSCIKESLLACRENTILKNSFVKVKDNTKIFFQIKEKDIICHRV